MNPQKWVIFAIVSSLVAGTGVFLTRLQTNLRLGAPGLRLAERPVFDIHTNIVGTNTIDLPLAVSNYLSERLPVTPDVLGWLPKDTTYGFREYKTPDGFWIHLNVVLMGSDRTSIHKPQICLDGQGWKIERSELLSIPIQEPHPYELPVMKLTSTKTAVRLKSGEVTDLSSVFVYWFVAENRLTAKHGERMWWMAKDLLTTGVLPRWAYVSYFAVCLPGQEEATYERIKEFIAASVPKFQIVTGPALTAGRRPEGAGAN